MTIQAVSRFAPEHPRPFLRLDAELAVPPEWGVGLPVNAAAFVGVDADALLTEMTRMEQLQAWIAARQLAMLHAVSTERETDLVAELGPGATSGAVQFARVEAAQSVADEVALATGLAPHTVQRRMDLARGERARSAPVREALAAGRMSLERALRFASRTVCVPAEQVQAVLDRVLAGYRGGGGGLDVPHARFCARLSRAVAAHATGRDRHRQELDRRGAFAKVYTEDGTGALEVTGQAARIAAAIERVDHIARVVRRGGDARTLGQLRSDIALDLLLHGNITPSSTSSDCGITGDTGEDASRMAPYAGRLPAARVTVTVSAASLLGATEEPGQMDCGSRTEYLPAHVIRDVAYAAGSTWRRLVTDPVSGYLADLSTTSYAVTGQLRERVQFRDRLSRVPGSGSPARRCDLDHEVDWADGGRSSMSNLSAKCRNGHNHKTRGTWSTSRPPGVNGEIEWVTRAGRRYVTAPWDYRDPDSPGVEEMWANLIRLGEESCGPNTLGLPAMPGAASEQSPPPVVEVRATRRPHVRQPARAAPPDPGPPPF